jgi:hypothetical protein
MKSNRMTWQRKVADRNNNEQFEQVLSRLDALMKRGQSPEVPPPPTPSALDEEAATETAAVEQLAAEHELPSSTTPFVILEEPTEIPVLTEVYDGEVTPAAADESSELAEAVIDALMPLMLENLDIIVAEEAARMQQNIAERLRVEIAATLRERLQTRKP